MKILLINETLKLGGAETLFVELANSLASNPEYDICVCASEGPLMERLDPALNVELMPCFTFRGSPGIVVRHLMPLLKRFRPDIVHGHGATTTILCALSAKWARVPTKVLLTHHSTTTARVPEFVGMKIIRSLCDHMIAISTYKETRLSDSGVPREKVTRIPNFINLSRFPKEKDSGPWSLRASLLKGHDDGILIVGIGRLIKAKRFERFVQIVNLVREKAAPLARGLIVGEGPYKSQIRGEIERLGAGGFIHLLGRRDDVPQLLSASDIFLLPSMHQEVLPMAIIEAMAAGLPIVTSAISGTRDLVLEGVNGYRIEDDSMEDYFRVLAELIGNPEQRIAMGARGRELVKQYFDRDVVLARIENLYQEMAGRASARASDWRTTNDFQ